MTRCVKINNESKYFDISFWSVLRTGNELDLETANFFILNKLKYFAMIVTVFVINNACLAALSDVTTVRIKYIFYLF